MRLFRRSSLLIVGLALCLPCHAGLVWIDHGHNHNYHTTLWDFNVGVDLDSTLTGNAGFFGSISTAFQCNGEYLFDTGYRNSGTFLWHKPGRIGLTPAFGGDFTTNPHGISQANHESLLAFRTGFVTQVNAATSFTGLQGGSLPAGSWLYFGGMISDEVLTISANSPGWYDTIYRIDQTLPQTPPRPGFPTVVSDTSQELIFKGSGPEVLPRGNEGGSEKGGVFIRTRLPLTSVSWILKDPTGFQDTDTGANTSASNLNFGIALDLPQSVYAAWASLPANGLIPGVNDGPDLDPDHDGIRNFLEFVLGGAPTVFSTSILPEITPTMAGVIVKFKRSRNARPGIQLVLQHSTDLISWTDVPVVHGIATAKVGSSFINVSVTAVAGGDDEVEVTLPRSASGKLYTRLKATVL